MLYAVILAGGSGTRLWPLSRKDLPKQALRLVGERSLFQQAVERLHPLLPLERILVVTRAEYMPILQGQTPDLPVENFILEPEGRGTAPAIALAAVHLRRRDRQAVMAVLTADHFIADIHGFQQALHAANRLAEDGHLVTLGVQPTLPSTGFGYIEQGESFSHVEGLEVFRLARFVEKPDTDTARRMVASGDYSWNSGMFVWRVERILEEFAQQMPALFRKAGEIGAALGKGSYAETLARIWPQVEKQTIDYGVMEGAQDAVVLPVDIGWVDVGSWASLYDLIRPDEQGNRWTGQHLSIDTRDTLAFNQGRLVATIGVEGLVIVETPDALLICPREREQEVRHLVQILKDQNLDEWL
jgi:mannose-1-phosphate guanylyltransferase